MQNLRDKLLKAGAVSKTEAREARTEARKQRPKGRAGREQSAAEQEEQRQRHRARLDQEAREARDREAEKARLRERHEAEERLRNITERHAQRRFEGDDRAFHFVDSARRVRRVHLSFAAADDLILGRLGIASAPYDEGCDFRLISAEGLARLEELAPERILFWNRPGATRSQP